MKRWWVVVLLSIAMSGQAQELSSDEVAKWLRDPQLNQHAFKLVELAKQGDVASIEFEIAHLKYPQQEVLRTLFIRHLMQEAIPANAALGDLVENQMHIPTVYRLVEYGDGYQFTVPAFNYPSIAASLLKSWHYQEQGALFRSQAESGDLDLRDWLGQDTKVRERVIVAHFSMLPQQQQATLTEQILQHSQQAWVPSTAIVATIARETQDPLVYALLWKMKVDGVVEKELAQVAEQKRGELLILAASNSALYPQAINYLTRFTEPSEDVSQFLKAEIQREDRKQLIESYFRNNNNLQMLTILQAP